MAFDMSTEEKKKAAYNYVNEYAKNKYDRITILRKQGDKQKLDQVAKEKGFRSTTEFINNCIDEKLKRMKIEL